MLVQAPPAVIPSGALSRFSLPLVGRDQGWGWSDAPARGHPPTQLRYGSACSATLPTRGRETERTVVVRILSHPPLSFPRRRESSIHDAAVLSRSSPHAASVHQLSSLAGQGQGGGGHPCSRRWHRPPAPAHGFRLALYPPRKGDGRPSIRKCTLRLTPPPPPSSPRRRESRAPRTGGSALDSRLRGNDGEYVSAGVMRGAVTIECVLVSALTPPTSCHPCASRDPPIRPRWRRHGSLLPQG